MSPETDSRDAARQPRRRQRRLLNCVAIGSQRGAYGGPWQTSLQQAQAAVRGGWSVSLIAGHLDGDRPEIDVQDIDVRLCRVRAWLPKAGFMALMSWRYIVMVVRAVIRADLVHVSLSREPLAIWPALIAVITRKTLVVQTHGMVVRDARLVARAIDFVLRPLFKRAHGVILLGAQEGRDLRSWLSGELPPTLTLGNPVNIRRIREAVTRVDLEPDEVLFLARLHPRKRVLDFADAALLAEANNLKGNYKVVGPSGPDLDALQQRVKSSAGRLRYEGPVAPTNVSERVAACEVFVLPSLNEPWGNVLLEALAMGKPVVLSRSAALASVLAAREAGVVVDDRSPEGIADAVHRILSSPSLRRKLSTNALAFAEEHDTIRLDAKLLDFYGALSGAAGGR